MKNKAPPYRKEKEKGEQIGQKLPGFRPQKTKPPPTPMKKRKITTARKGEKTQFPSSRVFLKKKKKKKKRKKRQTIRGGGGCPPCKSNPKAKGREGGWFGVEVFVKKGGAPPERGFKKKKRGTARLSQKGAKTAFRAGEVEKSIHNETSLGGKGKKRKKAKTLSKRCFFPMLIFQGGGKKDIKSGNKGGGKVKTGFFL